MPISHDTLFIGGAPVSPSSPARITVRNASTEEPIGEVPEAAEADVDAAVAAARRAFDDPSGWSQWEAARRGEALERLAAELEKRAQEISRLVSEQNGMPIALSPLIEGMTPVGTIRYVVSLLAGTPVEEETARFLGGDLIIRREPIGVVAGIVPWNYPQTLSSFKYAPALAAGNTVVLKPSPETVLDSYVFADAVLAAGLPPGVINIVPGGGNSAPTWSSTATSTRSRLPARPPRDGRSPRCAAGCCARSAWNSAANPRRSSSTTRTWTWPRSARTCSRPRWSTAGRRATPAPGSWPRGPGTTRWWTRSPRSPPRCPSATPSTRAR